MDQDPELDVTLSDGRHVATFQIAAVEGLRDAWAMIEPWTPRRVIRGCAEALAARRRLDARIAARLAAGWVPVDGRSAGTPSVPPTPLAPDLVLQISSLLEALTRARPALRAADPSGQLWAACHVFRHQAWRFGVGALGDRVLRARQERRQGELAEQAGDLTAAILHYRAALASHKGVGVKRRLLRLAPHGPATEPLTSRRAPGRDAGGGSRRVTARDRSSGPGPRYADTTGGAMKQVRVQIVGRIPQELSRRVRTAAKRRKISLNALLIDALAQAVKPRRAAETKGA